LDPQGRRPASRVTGDSQPYEQFLLVTGKSKRMAAVMYELVDVHALDQRGRAFLSADEVYCQHQQQAAEDCPGQHLANRDGDRARLWRDDYRRHHQPPWGLRISGDSRSKLRMKPHGADRDRPPLWIIGRGADELIIEAQFQRWR